MKYRIVKEYNLFYPQRKLFFWWQATEEPNYGYATENEALGAVQQHNRLFGKDSRKKNVVWEGSYD